MTRRVVVPIAVGAILLIILVLLLLPRNRTEESPIAGSTSSTLPQSRSRMPVTGEPRIAVRTESAKASPTPALGRSIEPSQEPTVEVLEIERPKLEKQTDWVVSDEPKMASPIESREGKTSPSWPPSAVAPGLQTSTVHSSEEAAVAALIPTQSKATTAPRPVPKSPRPAILEDGLVALPAGTFRMGDDSGLKYEKPVHEVRLSAFAISPRELTVKEWMGLTGQQPGNLNADPLQSVEFITWFEAIDYCNRLSKKRGFEPVYEIEGNIVRWNRKANGYRLPTEAEWEYAARAGSTKHYAGSDRASAVAVYKAEGPRAPGTLSPNEFGLYDMSGNVAGWCWDWWAPYDASSAADPVGPESGTERVYRGGSWFGLERSITVSARASSHPANRQRGVGLRLVRSLAL